MRIVTFILIVLMATVANGKSVPKVKITTHPSTHIAAPKNTTRTNVTTHTTNTIVIPVVAPAKSSKPMKIGKSKHPKSSEKPIKPPKLEKPIKSAKPIQPAHAARGGGYNWGIIDNPYCQ